MDDSQLLAWTAEHRLLFADTVDALGEEHAGDPQDAPPSREPASAGGGRPAGGRRVA